MKFFKYMALILVVTLLVLCVGLAIPIVLSDRTPVKEYLLRHAGKTIGGQIEAEHLELHVFSPPQIRLKQLTLKEPKSSQTLLELKEGHCELALLKLLKGRIVFDQCMLFQPTIILRKDQDNSWNLLISSDIDEDNGPSLLRFLVLKNLGVDDGHITLIDASLPENPRTLSFSHLQAKVLDTPESNQLTFHVSTAFLNNKSSSNLSMKGHLQLTQSLSNDPESISVDLVTAKIVAQDVILLPLLDFMAPGTKLVANPKANLEASLSLFPDKGGYTLIVSDLATRIEGMNIHGKASITGLFGHEPAFFFTSTISQSPIEKLIQLVPRSWLSSEIRSIVDVYTITGNFEIEQFTVAGLLDQNKKPSIQGNVRISNGRFDAHTNLFPLQNIRGSLLLERDHLLLDEFAANYGASNISQARGRIEFRVPHPWLTLIVHGDLHAADVLKTIRQLPTVKQHSPAWLDLRQVEGDAMVALEIKGPLTDPKQLKIHRGELRIRNLGFHPVAYPLPIRAINGHMLIDQDHLSMQSFSAEYEASKILEANGGIEFRKDGPWLRLTARGDLHAADVLNTVRQLRTVKQHSPAWLDLRQVEGDAIVALEIKGPLTDPKQLKIHRGELSVRNLGFHPADSPLPIRSVSGRIGFDHEHAVIHALRGRVGQSRTTLLGSVFYGHDRERQDLTLRSRVEPSDFKLLVPILSERDSLSGGPLDTSIKISGSSKQRNLHLSIDFTPLNVSYPAVLQKPSGIPMWLKFDGTLMPDGVLKLHQSSLAIPPFHIDMKGELSLDASRMVNVTLTTGSDKGSWLPKGVIVGHEQLGIRYVEANLSVKGTEKDWMAWQTSGIIDVNKPSAIATQTSTATAKTGRIQWTQENHMATMHIRTQDMPLEAIIPKESAKAPKISGNLMMDVSLETALTPRQPLTRSMFGKGEFQIRDGHIVHSPVISKIMSLLNLPSLLTGKVDLKKEGMPFNSMTGTFTLTKGLMASKDLLLNSPVLKMTAAGQYDLPEDQLDFMVAVSPFGEYSNLLKSIPLFGQLLKGERKGLTTALFEVKGLRTDPQVTYQPLKSFSEGLQGFAQFAVDVLKNTIMLPKDLMTEPQEGNVSSRE